MSNLQIIVARYNEDVSWLELTYPICTIYNKGLAPLHAEEATIIPAENVGREADTYLRYIIEHYDDLPDYMFFTQAYIGDHVRDLKETSIILSALQKGNISTNYYNLSAYGTKCVENFDDDTHSGIPLEEGWELLFDEKKDTIHCNYNAIFVVSKARVQYRSKEFYKAALQFNNENEEGAYVLERLWRTIFDGETKSRL